MRWISSGRAPPQYIFSCYPEDDWYNETDKCIYKPNFEKNVWECEGMKYIEFPKKTQVISEIRVKFK
jgi:hypothetical protein|uniref:Uncharacterized protein n=1 Tax=uncultured Caudovirales phage TaxID=2100421 RepID=A0A6J5L1W1_9CAUD|nr:hypothetical protein UFOVP88_48 [uncultured Caudovirales phage]